MHSLFDRILRVIHETGDRCVVIDRTSDSAFVVLPWSAYERLVGASTLTPLSQLTSDELLEKINRDVEEWQAANLDGEPLGSLSEAKNEPTRQPQPQAEATEQFYFEPIE